MSDMVRVPAEKIAALREALDFFAEAENRVDLAARAVVDAVETEDEPSTNPDPLCTRCGHGHMPEDSCPTPTRPPRPPACGKCDTLWTPGHVCEPDDRLAEAWDEGHEICRQEFICSHENPYRDTLTDAEIEHIQAAIMGTDDPWYALKKAMESIVASRVRAAQTQAWEDSCWDHYGDGHYSGLDSCPRNPYSDAGDEFQNPED